MNIGDLDVGTNNVAITAKVKEITDIRDVQTKYGPNTVADAIIEDETGTIKLVLWGKQIDQVKAGSSISLTGGYVKDWRGEKQLGVGKTGSIKAVQAQPEAKAPKEAVEEEIEEAPIDTEEGDEEEEV